MELIIAFVSDTHGNLAELGRAAALLGGLRREHEHVIFIDNGDSIQGSPLVHYFSARAQLSKDHPYVKAMHLLGCDFAVPGNHDFDYGAETLRNVVASSSFAWLAANVAQPKRSEAIFLPYAIKTVGSVRVAVVGATTQVPMWKDPERVHPFRFLDETACVARTVSLLRERELADYVIVSYHGGLESASDANGKAPCENQGRRILETVPGIDLLITGHQHRELVERRGAVLVVQPGHDARKLGTVTLTFEQREDGGTWSCRDSRAQLVDLSSRDADSEFVAALQPYEEQSREWLDRSLCRLPGTTIFGDFFAEVCLHEHAWVQWMHDVQMSACGVDISAVTFKNPSFSRTCERALTIRDVLRFFPYPDDLCVALLTGRQIREALEISASFFELDADRNAAVHRAWREPHPLVYQYVMWDGIHYELDLSRPIGSRVTVCGYRGGSIEPERSYAVAMTQFVKNAAPKYPLFRSAPTVKRVEREFTDLLIEDASRRTTLDVRPDLNWSIHC